MKCLLVVVAVATLHGILGEDASNAGCGSGWFFHEEDNKCIRPFGKESGSWASAEVFCEKEGGRLLSIHNSLTTAFVSKILLNDKSSYWIGLSQTPLDKRFAWQDGTLLTGYQAWGAGEPNNDHTQDECVVRYSSGFWDDEHCYVRRSFICEKEGPGCQKNNGGCSPDQVCVSPSGGSWNVKCSCKPGFASHDGHCYDIDECSYDNGGCDDICTNSVGGHSCSCREGYVAIGGTCSQDTIVG